MFKRNSMNKLCTLAIICCLSITSAFAADEIKYEKEILKAIKQNKIENLTEDYINQVQELACKQAYDKKEVIKALKTVDYLIKITQKFYGTNSQELARAYAQKADILSSFGSPSEAINAIKEAEKHAFLNLQNEEDANYIKNSYKHLYLQIEQPTKAKEYTTTESDKNQKILTEIQYLKNVDQYKKAIKKLKTLEKTALETNNKDLLADIYVIFLDIYKNSNNYKEVLNYLEKAEKLEKEYDYLKYPIVDTKSNYYKEFSEYKKAKEIILTNFPTKTEQEKAAVYDMLYDIDKTANNIELSLEYVKFIDNFYSQKYPKNSIERTKFIYDKYLAVYKDLNNKKKAEEYFKKIEELIVPEKEIAPILYANYLVERAHFNGYIDNHEKAKEAFEQAISIYEKIEPSKHILAEVYGYYAEYNFYENNKIGFKYIKKAIKHNKKYYSNSNKTLADFYEKLIKFYAETGNNKKAQKYLNKTIALYTQMYGENNIKTIEKKKIQL